MMTGYWRSFWQLEVTAMHPSPLFFFLATLHSLWDLGSLTRDRTRAPCSGSTDRVLTTRLPRKSYTLPLLMEKCRPVIPQNIRPTHLPRLTAST